jgi:hypothetical protein
MPYWLTNPDHGVMPVYDLSDVERNKVHGWELLNHGPAPEFAKKGNLAIPEADFGNVLKPYADAFNTAVADIPVKRKPGRPPKVK